MNIYLDCIPCFLRQSIDAARKATTDTRVHEQVVREVLRLSGDLDLALPPPWVSQKINRLVVELTGVDDLYFDEKKSFNAQLMRLLPDLKSDIKKALDPLVEAAKLAIAANIIDLGAKASLSEKEIYDALRTACEVETHGDWSQFHRTLHSAEKILYLADNSGEIVADRLLIEQLGPKRVTLAVRGSAILNDATMTDAKEAGLDKIVDVIDNGSDAPGTILSDCSENFMKHFNEADVIISKGQGNFETLSEVDANIIFLFKVKCPVIGAHAGLPTGTHAMLLKSKK
ncbi:MAG: DUF89 family protein [Deltaproteobacteria bacterium]|nr:DUF89 family protein [Deltaproteobacteria bacterium]